MPTVVVENGSGMSNSNSYVSISDVDTYYDAHLYSSAWQAADSLQKAAAVIQATALVDLYTDFDGIPTTTGQGLRCPRIGLWTREGIAYGANTIPVILKHAVCELTRFLLSGDRTVDPDTAGYSHIQVGPIAVTIDGSDRPDVIPDLVRRMLSEFGGVAGGSNVMRMIPVERV